MDAAMLAGLARNPFDQTGAGGSGRGRYARAATKVSGAVAFQLAIFPDTNCALYHHDIAPYEIAPGGTPAYEGVFVALAKVIWWINAAWVMTCFTRVFLIFERRPREGRLLQDLIVGVIYLGATLSAMAYVFGGPVGILIATLE